ncbi:hypothetical protein COT99_00930 [Candidatus Falkowbacteria bacterium CG10_big_fil_rev_8_21_14_0_10_43_10]|uniref:Uncharacterized protein n=1 Tax=Candidatus Falkowbacteria bacterium CG10_big_fil_rev_8_21_14_0_10_43_10 TaxID=1974567 RepID=A0A2H0V2Q5_9BACT|nr:MAG: hypothetical protein COT99_00930 [Candidatus Falkowbacteria bacterium CG10_big_fil_rev_8_21_14_0_10_43_10]
MKNLKDKILEKIKHGDAKQTPKWQFQLREFLIWFGVGILTAVAALVFAAIIFNLQSADWALRPRLGLTRSRFLFIHLPYFWIIASIGLVVLAYYAFRHTKKGYRYALPVIILMLTVLIISFGWASHRSFMAGRFMEQGAMQGVPYYNMMIRPRQALWLNPGKGFLAGEIISPYSDDEFSLSDIDKNIWRVRCRECFVHPLVEMEKNEKIRIIGEKLEDLKFEALEISPFFGPPDFSRPEIRRIMR